MKDNVQILIVPDVHGRSFWKAAIPYIEAGVETVFLGDYHDPYPHEGITPAESFENFKQIVSLAQQHPNMHLLLGNHDCGYYMDNDFCECRHDEVRHNELHQMFAEGDFRFAHEAAVGNRRFLFTHAGVNTKWAKKFRQVLGNEGTIPSAETLNTAFAGNNDLLYQALDVYSNYRGWSPYDFGSIVWGDIRDYLVPGSQYADAVQVVGHTQLNQAVSFGNIICTDTHECYYVDDHGNVRVLATDALPVEENDES